MKLQPYNTNIALKLAYDCLLSYKSNHENSLPYINGFMYVNDISGDVYIICRGSQDIVENQKEFLFDWMNNLNISSVEEIEGIVGHRGAYRNVLADLNIIKDFISVNLELGAEIYISGQSQGGMEAVLLAAILNDYVDVDWRCTVYTYGAPNSISNTSAKWIEMNKNIAHYRHVNPDYFVYKLLDSMYEQVGNMIYMTEERYEMLQVGQTKPSDPVPVDYDMHRYLGSMIGYGHSMEKYISLLERYLGIPPPNLDPDVPISELQKARYQLEFDFLMSELDDLTVDSFIYLEDDKLLGHLILYNQY